MFILDGRAVSPITDAPHRSAPRPSHTPRLLPRLVGALLAFGCLCTLPTTLHAQDAPTSQPTSQPASQPATQPAATQAAPEPPTPTEVTPTEPTAPTVRPEETEATATDVSRDAIQNRLTQIQAATDLPEMVKTEVLGLYRQALDQLGVSESWDQKTRELETGRTRAPDLLKEAKARIEQATTRPTSQPVPQVAPDETLEQLSAKLTNREADLKAAQDAAKRLDEEKDNRAARKVAIPGLLADANKRREKIVKDLAVPPAAGTVPQLALARRTLLMAQKLAVEGEIREYEEELRYYDARSTLLTARQEEAKLAVNAAQATVAVWQDLVGQRRQAEIDRQKQAAEDELARARGRSRDMVEQNAALTKEWDTVSQRIKALQDQYKVVTDKTEKLGKQFADLQKREREDPDALAEIIGPEMRRIREELVLLRSYERELRALEHESARVERRCAQIDEEALDLNADLEGHVATRMENVPTTTLRVPRSVIEERIRDLFTARRDTLRKIQPDYHAYAEDLRGLRVAEGKLLAKADQFRTFIDQHILWLRSMGPIQTMQLPDGWKKTGPAAQTVARSLLADVLAHPIPYAAALLGLTVLLALRPRMRARMREVSQRVARPFSDTYRLTLRAGTITILQALPWPGLLWFLGWRIGSAVETADAASYDLAQAIASGLGMAAVITGTLVLIRHVCGVKGLAEAHFRWNIDAVRLVRNSVAWFVFVAAPVAFVVYATERHPESAWRSSVGRAAFMIGMVALTVFLHRLLRPAGAVFARAANRSNPGWGYNLRYVSYTVAVLGPLALAVASAFGFHYTAVQFCEDLVRTAWLILVLLLLHAMLIRWLFVAQRRLAIEQVRKKRAAAAEAEAAQASGATSTEAPEIDEAKLDLVAIGDQTKRLVRSMTAFGLIIGLWLIWADMLPALSFMQNVELWPYTVSDVETTLPTGAEAVGGEPTPTMTQRVEYITLAHVALAIVITVVTFALARNIPGLLEIALLQRLPLDTGGRYAIAALARYTIGAIGIISAFGAVGIGWSKVQWLIAAMTVGLGFGLQEIFANFVSGVMLLFERPIRIGDTVTIGDVHGTVTRIRIRATTITDWDRKELIIPNKEFVTGQVINWTLSDSVLRTIIPVGIAYGSDTDLAEKLLYQVAEANELVLADPKTRVIFGGFGDNSLNFELRVFVAHIDHLLNVRHQLHKAIDREFRAAGIEIAFPQRDIHIRSIQQALPIVNDRADQAVANMLREQ